MPRAACGPGPSFTSPRPGHCFSSCAYHKYRGHLHISRPGKYGKQASISTPRSMGHPSTDINNIDFTAYFCTRAFWNSKVFRKVQLRCADMLCTMYLSTNTVTPNTGQVVAELKVVTSNKLCEPIL